MYFVYISLSIASLLSFVQTLSNPAVYKPLPALKGLECSRVLNNDVEYIREKAKKRLVYKDDPLLSTDCTSIKNRHYFADQPASTRELNFPIAMARTVFRDYLFLESELAANYAPQNVYCFALDAKVDEVFRQRVHDLASCFPNVFVNNKEFPMDSMGHNQTSSLLECMNQLAKPQYKWKYLITLQNHDVQLKTNEELVQIFSWMKGANDVEICHLPEGRVNTSMDWSFESLGILKNKRYSPNDRKYSRQLEFAKGYLQSSLSREFVDFVILELNVSRVLSQLETGACFVDEVFFQTLSATDALEAPGGFTHECLDRGYTAAYVTRFGVWLGNNSRCHSKFARHFVCIFGLEDLALNFKESHSLFGNKMLPSFDFGAIECWHEEMFNRTHFKGGISRLNPNVYLRLPQVRYQAEKGATKEGARIDCEYRIPIKEKLKMYDGQTDGRRKKVRKTVFKNVSNFDISGCHLPKKK